MRHVTDPHIESPLRNTGSGACGFCPAAARAARPLLAPAALAALVALAACGGNDDPAEAAAAPAREVVVAEPQPTGCPRVVFVEDAAQEVRFRPGAGRDLTDVEWRAAFVGFGGGCEYDDEAVDVELILNIAAERGPAATGGEAALDYFVAVADPQQQLLVKEIFETSIVFPESGDTAGTSEELVQRIPLDNPALGRAYRIVVGFQLSPDQLEFNRR